MSRLGTVAAARARAAPEPFGDSRADRARGRSPALWVRDPRVLLLTQSTNLAAGTGVYVHRVQNALRSHGVTVRLVKLSEAFSVTDAIALRAAIDDLDPHVVHVLHCLPRHLLRLSGLRAERPLVLTVHNLPPWECNVRFGYSSHRVYMLARNTRYAPAAALVRAALRIRPPTAVVCDSRAVLRHIVGILPSRTRVFECPLGPSRGDLPPRGTDSGEAPRHHLEPSGPPVKQLVTVGGFIFHKGLHRLIPILARLKRDGLACRVDILGRRRDPSYFAFVSRLVARHRLDDAVRLLPDATEADIDAALERAHLYVQPSLEEGFCLTFLDAALTVPCLVGTDVGAIPEIAAVRGDTASCVPRHDDTALEHSIRRHLERPAAPPVSPAVRRILSARYSWSAVGTRLLRIYGRVSTTRRRRW